MAAPAEIAQQGGRIVVLCTAQGLQRVMLSAFDGQPLSQAQAGSSCPVCLLGHATALPGTTLGLYLVAMPVSSAALPPPLRARPPKPSGTRIRAPPIV